MTWNNKSKNRLHINLSIIMMVIWSQHTTLLNLQFFVFDIESRRFGFSFLFVHFDQTHILVMGLHKRRFRCKIWICRPSTSWYSNSKLHIFSAKTKLGCKMEHKEFISDFLENPSKWLMFALMLSSILITKRFCLHKFMIVYVADYAMRNRSDIRKSEPTV